MEQLHLALTRIKLKTFTAESFSERVYRPIRWPEKDQALGLNHQSLDFRTTGGRPGVRSPALDGLFYANHLGKKEVGCFGRVYR